MDTMLYRGPWTYVALALWLTGCPGRLEDPERFAAPSTAADASVADAAMDDDDGTGCQVEMLFENRCTGSGCHDNSMNPGGELDLLSPGIAERLVGRSSTTCEGRLRIDPANPSDSFFLEKLGDAPECGSRMPLAGAPLADEQMECVKDWVTRLAEEGGTDAGAAPDAGPEEDAGGTDGGAS